MRKPRKYHFRELSEEAKQAARDAFTGEGYLDYDWWEHVYEDAVECAALLGIEIDDHEIGRTRTNTSIKGPDIQWSGFWSQGDGASFTGRYKPPEDPMAILEHAPQDKELHRIAETLIALQVAAKIDENDHLEAKIERGRYGGNSCHSGVMRVDVHAIDDDGDDKGEPLPEEVKGLEKAMRDFADWIYRQLEQEYEYRHSNECVDEQLADHRFSKDGAWL